MRNGPTVEVYAETDTLAIKANGVNVAWQAICFERAGAMALNREDFLLAAIPAGDAKCIDATMTTDRAFRVGATYYLFLPGPGQVTMTLDYGSATDSLTFISERP